MSTKIQKIKTEDCYQRYITSPRAKTILENKTGSDTITLDEALTLITECLFIFGANYVQNPRDYPSSEKATNQVVEFLNNNY